MLSEFAIDGLKQVVTVKINESHSGDDWMNLGYLKLKVRWKFHIFDIIYL